ncbi:MAG TPA: CDP-diacylglycerol--glycerol-3-phosphate 3-phosphatidyltransferase [Desulfurella acetivorans]|uniref:CDP-diacylglycerol--glycerol-3-phosphate 3-phosphatidyltransferase n=1 Tax=Desulfurella acetivorans TaxID=33002 RepID=A0A7C6A603_DESAE|nr:CDP-diacylglycerol--glycerol-3-phosphate 3-phosphatidyltransferase [Desulfurella acetivorans]
MVIHKSVPNVLSITRIIITIPVILLLESHHNYSALLLFLIGVLSDYLDGYLARKKQLVSNIGKLLDPLADKIFVISLFVAMIKIMGISYWLVLIIIFREFAVTGLRAQLAAKNFILPALIQGKIKTFSQFVALGFLVVGSQNKFFFDVGMVFLYITVVTTLTSGVEYYIKYWKVINE